MPIRSLLTELDRKIILFSYENTNKATQPIFVGGIDDDLRTFVITEGDYILWQLNKRKLDEREIIHRTWLLNSQYSHSFVVNFTSDKKLSVKNLFSEKKHVGEWGLENGILKIAFYYQEVQYNITVIANNCGTVHSGLQINENLDTELLRIAPLRHATEGAQLIFDLNLKVK